MHIIEFAPPMSGFSGIYNTFRLGVRYSRILIPNETIALVNSKELTIFGYAIVTGLLTGPLRDMANLHATFNHNQRHLDSEGAADRLIANMVKRYGPHKCDENKRVTVIYLREKPDDHT